MSLGIISGNKLTIIDSSTKLTQNYLNFDSQVLDFSWSFNNGYFLAVFSSHVSVYQDTCEKAFDIHCEGPLQARFNENNSILYILCVECLIIFNCLTKQRQEIEIPDGRLLEVSIDGHFVGIGGRNLITYDTQTKSFGECGDGAPQALGFSFLVNGLVATSVGSSITLWNAAENNSLVHVFSDSHSAEITGVCFSPNNRYLMCSCGLDSKVTLYDVEKRTILKRFTTAYPPRSISFKPDGVTVAIIGDQIALQSLRQNEPSHLFPINATKALFHNRPSKSIQYVAFDGKVSTPMSRKEKIKSITENFKKEAMSNAFSPLRTRRDQNGNESEKVKEAKDSVSALSKPTEADTTLMHSPKMVLNSEIPNSKDQKVNPFNRTLQTLADKFNDSSKELEVDLAVSQSDTPKAAMKAGTKAVTRDTSIVSDTAASRYTAAINPEVFSSLIDETFDLKISSMQSVLRNDIQNIHLEMLKQFHIQRAEMETLLQQYQPTAALEREVCRLRDENEELRRRLMNL